MRLLPRVEYHRATDAAALEQIYQLRYRAYLREGTIEPHLGRRLWDRFDESSNSSIFGIHIDGELAGSIRVHEVSVASPVSMSLEVFPEQLEPEVERGKTIIDPTRFVAEPNVSQRYPELPYLTLRVLFKAALDADADIATAPVRPEHQAFYRRVLQYRPVCAPRTFPPLTKPLGLMMADFRAEKAGVLARYPFFASEAGRREPYAWLD